MEDERTYPRNGFQTPQMKWRVKAMTRRLLPLTYPANNRTIWEYRARADSALKSEKSRKPQAKPSHELIQQKSKPRNCEQ